MPKRVSSPTHMAQKLRYNARARRFGINGRARWGAGTIQAVLDHNRPDSELGKQIGRSIQAIQAIRNRYTGGDKFAKFKAREAIAERMYWFDVGHIRNPYPPRYSPPFEGYESSAVKLVDGNYSPHGKRRRSWISIVVSGVQSFLYRWFISIIGGFKKNGN